MSKTILIFGAHPDDAEFFAGGTIAKMIQEGARAVIVIATDGRRGSFEHDSRALIQLRAEEARRAAQALGADPPVLLGHADWELDQLPPGRLREQFIRLIRQHKPEAVFTHDPAASREAHPDHRAVGWAAFEAVTFTHLPLMHPEHLADGLEPHLVAEKYFFSDGTGDANKVMDIAEALSMKLAALAEHKTQMVFLVEDIRRQARAAGLDFGAILGEAANDPMAAMAWALERQAAEVGRQIGARYGEAFRYARFHPLVEGLWA